MKIKLIKLYQDKNLKVIEKGSGVVCQFDQFLNELKKKENYFLNLKFSLLIY